MEKQSQWPGLSGEETWIWGDGTGGGPHQHLLGGRDYSSAETGQIASNGRPELASYVAGIEEQWRLDRGVAAGVTTMDTAYSCCPQHGGNGHAFFLMNGFPLTGGVHPLRNYWVTKDLRARFLGTN